MTRHALVVKTRFRSITISNSFIDIHIKLLRFSSLKIDHVSLYYDKIFLVLGLSLDKGLFLGKNLFLKDNARPFK